MLKLTTELRDVNHRFLPTILELFYSISQFKIEDKLLANKYELLTFFYSIELYHSNFVINNNNKVINNNDVTSNKVTNNNDVTSNKVTNNKVTIKDNLIIVNNYMLLPVIDNYMFNELSYLSPYYFLIKKHLPKNSITTIIQLVSPSELNIKDNKLNLSFNNSLYDFLKNNNCIVKVLFIYFDKLDKFDKLEFTNLGKDDLVINANLLYQSGTKINKFLENSEDIIIEKSTFQLFKSTDCHSELSQLPLLIYLFDKVLNSIKEHGNLYYAYDISIYKPTFQLLYYMRNQFTNMHYYENTLNVESFGFIKYEDFIPIKSSFSSKFSSKSPPSSKSDKVKNNKLTLIIDEYITHDKYLGQHNVIINTMENKYCHNVDLNQNTDLNTKNANRTIIQSLFGGNGNGNNIDSEFMTIFEKIHEKKNHAMHQMIKQVKYIQDMISQRKELDTIITFLVSTAIEFCNEHGIPINEKYIDFKPLNYKEFIYKYFKKINNVNLNNIEINIDSNYSITLPANTEKIAKYIKKDMPSVEYIIDGTTNIGSTAAVLSQYFKKIYSVEIDKKTYQKLIHNIAEYKINNIISYHYDIITFMKDKLQEIGFNLDKFCLFLDPPWSGAFYKTETLINLFLSDINIVDFIKKIKCKYIAIKVPYNYNFALLYLNFYNITIYRVQGFFLVLIKKEA